MSGKQTKYYWDANVYLAWLKEENTYAAYLPSSATIARQCSEQKAIVVTSSIIFTEIFPSRQSKEVERKFYESFEWRTHIAYDVDIKIAKLAGELRDYFASNPFNGKDKLLTPDAIHLATAIILKVDVFNTFDDGKKEKRGISLLSLNKHRRLNSLLIEKPQVDQPDLPGTVLPVAKRKSRAHKKKASAKKLPE